jgi:hypothetical protein
MKTRPIAGGNASVRKPHSFSSNCSSSLHDQRLGERTVPRGCRLPGEQNFLDCSRRVLQEGKSGSMAQDLSLAGFDQTTVSHFFLMTVNVQKEPHLSPGDRWGTRKPGMVTPCRSNGSVAILTVKRRAGPPASLYSSPLM